MKQWQKNTLGLVVFIALLAATGGFSALASFWGEVWPWLTAAWGLICSAALFLGILIGAGSGVATPGEIIVCLLFGGLTWAAWVAYYRRR